MSELIFSRICGQWHVHYLEIDLEDPPFSEPHHGHLSLQHHLNQTFRKLQEPFLHYTNFKTETEKSTKRAVFWQNVPHFGGKHKNPRSHAGDSIFS
jgi:hypothetical protein